MPTDKDKRRRLKDEGVLVGELPDAHAEVVDTLTDEEIEVIVSVKKRLEEADEESGLDPGPEGEPPFTFIMHF